MIYTGRMIDTEIEHARLHPEPSIIPYGHGPLSSGTTFLAAPPGPRVVPFGPHNQFIPGHQLTDGPPGIFKGKTIEGLHVNPQYYYRTPASSHFVVPEYIGFNVIPVVMGPGHHRGTRNQTAGAIDLNLGLHFMPMSLCGLEQHVQVVPGPWLDQQFCANVHGLPFMPGN